MTCALRPPLGGEAKRSDPPCVLTICSTSARPSPTPSVGFWGSPGAAEQWLGEARERCLLDEGTVVGDGEDNLVWIAGDRRRPGVGGHANAACAVLDRVSEQVLDELVEQQRIRDHERGRRGGSRGISYAEPHGGVLREGGKVHDVVGACVPSAGGMEPQQRFHQRDRARVFGGEIPQERARIRLFGVLGG